MKFRNIIKNEILKSRIKVLIADSRDIFLRDSGKNGFEHSEKVEDILDRLVPDKIKKNKTIFGEAEIFYLLYSVYLHDVGRKIGVHHEKETYDEILRNPDKYGLKNEFDANAVAEICYGHASDSERPIKDIKPSYPIAGLDKPLNLQFLAALLRLADELDNDFIRVQGINDQNNSIRKMIRSVHIEPKTWTIEIQSDTVNYEDREKLANLKISIQERLDEIKDILRPKELLYNHIDMKIEKVLENKKELEKEIYNMVSENKDVPYIKINSNNNDCSVFGDIFGFSGKVHYFYSHKVVTIEKLENILETYRKSLRKDFQFNFPSFLINQTCNTNKIYRSWSGYGNENFIRALKERDIRYSDAGIVDPHHSESAGYIVDGGNHIFYIAVLPELNLENYFDIDVGFVFEGMLFDNEKYIEFYKNIGLDVPDFYEVMHKDFSESITTKFDIEVKVEGYLRYKFDNEYWISKIICKNPYFYDKTLNEELTQHEKIIINVGNHHKYMANRRYCLNGARIIQIPYGVFKFNILNIRGDWIDGKIEKDVKEIRINLKNLSLEN